MVAEQITSSGSSPWEEIGDDVEQKLSGMKRAKMSGKKGKSKRGEELRSSAPVGARDAVTSESKLSSQNLAQANPEPETKVFDMEAPTSSTPEPILNNTSDVEVGKRRGEKKPVGSPMSRRRRNSNPERGREKPQEGVEESLPISTVSEEVLEVKEEKAEEIENGVSKPEVSEVPGDISEDAGKNEALPNSPKPRIRRMAVVGNSVQSTPPEKQADQSAEIKQEDIVIAKREQDNGVDWKDVQKGFDEEGKKIQEDRTRSMQFNRLDAQASFDEETKRLENRDRLAERFRGVKSFDELSVLLNDPEFPGIQGSKQFYSGDDLKRIIAMARETGATNFATRSHGFLDTVERLLREEKEGKTGALKEDDIVEGFGVVSEKVSENVFGETMDLKPNIPVISEKKERNGGEESSLEGEYLPAGEESLQELRERIKTLKHSADESRNRFLALRHRNTSKWLAIKKALFPLRSKEPPESMVNELNLLKSDWTHKLTLYKDAVVELAKRGVAQRELGGKTQGELMAEAIRGLDLQGSIENYDAWKNASWGDRKDSGFLRALGRARDWAEQYRKLDWKKRVAISAAVVGTGVAGVAVGSAGLVGLGVAGSTLVRLLGAYGAGRGSYEFLEGRAAQKTLKYHEAALSHVEKIKDIGFLEQRMKSYADRTQKDLDRAIAGNRKRVIASVALGSALFLGGSAFAYRGAIQEFSGKVSSGFSKFLEQAKIISGLEDFHAAPVSITGAVDRVVETTNAVGASSLERVSSSASAPLSVETAVPVPSTIEPSGFVSDVDVAGMGTDHSVAAEIVGEIGKNISETSVVPEGSSFERVLSERLTETGIPKEEAGKLVHRAMLDLAEKTGKPFEFFNHIRPGAEIQYEIGSDRSLHVFGVTRKAGGEVIKRVAESVSGGTPSPVGVVRESILQPKSLDISNASSPTKTLPLASSSEIPTATIESPKDIFEQRLPNISVPSLEDTLKGNVSPDVSVPTQLLEGISANASVPTPDFESLNLAVSGSEYLKNVGTIVKERLTFLPLSQTQKDLIENIFSARIPTANTEPTASSILFVRDTLGKALFSSDDVARWMQDDIEHVQEKVNKAVYAGLVRVGGESLRIGKMIAEGETVESWLTKMARHILMHRIGPAQ